MEGVVVNFKNLWPSNSREDNGDITSGGNSVSSLSFCCGNLFQPKGIEVHSICFTPLLFFHFLGVAFVRHLLFRCCLLPTFLCIYT